MTTLAIVHVQLYDVKKHSVRYNAEPSADPPAVTSVYISKSVLTEPYPQKLTISIDNPSQS